MVNYSSETQPRNTHVFCYKRGKNMINSECTYDANSFEISVPQSSQEFACFFNGEISIDNTKL